MNRLKIVFASSPDRDDIYPEIWVEDDIVGEAFRRGNDIVLRLYPGVDLEVSQKELEDLFKRLREEFLDG